MNDSEIISLIEQRFSGLSPQLRQAARFVIDNPETIALNSMRSAAESAKVHPSTMLRLARQLGFDSYDPFRDRFRDWLMARGSSSSWSGRAQTLRRQPRGSASATLVENMVAQEQDNLRATFDADALERLNKACALISGARRVYILGLRSLFPIAFYFHYVCRMFMNKTVLLTGVGGTFADELRNVDSNDVLIAFSYQPYARDTVKAVKFARERGARIVAVSDSRVAPVIGSAEVGIVVSNATPSLFPTILPGFAVAQALVALLVSESGDETMAEIARSELQLDSFGVYVDGRN